MIKILIVDDSALVRKVLSEIINQAPGMQVVGAAPDPLAARDMIRALDPDVLTLDVEMPRMDGLEFLARLMRLRPMPVVMIASLTERGSEVTLRALELGAVDFVAKPKIGISGGLVEYANEIIDKLRVAARVRPRRLAAVPNQASQPISWRGTSTEKLIFVGASTGGTEAIREFLCDMPADCPGILITQHMPESFTRQFAARLDACCRMKVMEATGGERVLPGHVYIAPGHSHLVVDRSGANYVTRLSAEAPVNRHRPSVDVLFDSAARAAGANCAGVILTGMGKDGAAGMLRMNQGGAYTLAQDEASCVVFGMPKEAIACGGVSQIAPLHELAGRVLAHLAGGERVRAVRV